MSFSNLRNIKCNFEEYYRKFCEAIISFRKTSYLEKCHCHVLETDTDVGIVLYMVMYQE